MGNLSGSLGYRTNASVNKASTALPNNQWDRIHIAIVEHDLQIMNLFRHGIQLFLITFITMLVTSFTINDLSYYAYDNSGGVLEPAFTLVKGFQLFMIQLIGMWAYGSKMGLPRLESYYATIPWVFYRENGTMWHRIVITVLQFWANLWYSGLMLAGSYAGFYANGHIVLAATGVIRGMTGTTVPTLITTYYSYFSIMAGVSLIFLIYSGIFYYEELADHGTLRSWPQRTLTKKVVEKLDTENQVYYLTQNNVAYALLYAVSFSFTYTWFGTPADLNYIIGSYLYTQRNFNDVATLVGFAFIGSAIAWGYGFIDFCFSVNKNWKHYNLFDGGNVDVSVSLRK